jgi:PPOX class probable FMN-dependent enzyme
VPDLVTSEAPLDALYGQPAGPAGIKEIDHISEHYRRFIETSPFVILAISGPEGLDCTPRGDPPGFVRVVDSRIVILPDRRGNNRIDSLRNIVRDPRIALLFLIPGVGRTLRINGRAVISIDPDLCASFAMEGKVPRSVIAVTAERVYTQCPKAPRSPWQNGHAERLIGPIRRECLDHIVAFGEAQDAQPTICARTTGLRPRSFPEGQGS